MQLFINYWSTSLTVAATAEAVSLSVPPAEAAKLVGLGSGDHYALTLFELDADTGAELRREIVRCTAKAGGVLTVERGQEGTGAQLWDAGHFIEARLTQVTMETLRDSAGGGAPLSNDDPAPLGSVNPGESSEASRSDHVHPLPTPAEIGAATAAQGAAADAAIPLAQKGAASGVATLDSESKIPLAQLPATAITSTFVVNTEAAMLALSAQEGDVAIRPDIGKSFILQAEPASTLANWQELLSPGTGGGAPVGSDTPQPLGTASPGVSSSASRQDHVHAMPSAAAVGADPAGAAAAAQAAAVQRSNHTGSQAISTVTGLQGALDAKATNPMTAAGDLIVGGSSGAPTRLPIGSALQVPRVNAAGTGIEYHTPAAGAVLPVVRAITANEALGLTSINTFGFNSTASNYTSTIPAQATVTWTADAEMSFKASSTGTLTITAAAGVTLNGVVAGSLTLQAGAAGSIKRKSADVWEAVGAFGTAAQQRAALGVPSAFGMRNLFINGNFAINQREYVSGAATTGANQYTLDRWRVVTSGQNLTFIASGNGNQITAPAGGVEQVIEGVNIAGGTYVLNWTGTATATVNGTARTKGEVFTLTAATNATVRLIGGTASEVQLEAGSVVTAFEFRPYTVELALCQRYLPAFIATATNQSIGLGYSYAAGNSLVNFDFKVTPRVAPTGVTISSAGHFNVGNGSGATISATSIGLNFSGISNCQLVVGGSGFTVGQGSFLTTNNASARIYFNGCEL